MKAYHPPSGVREHNEWYDAISKHEELEILEDDP